MVCWGLLGFVGVCWGLLGFVGVFWGKFVGVSLLEFVELT